MSMISVFQLRQHEAFAINLKRFIQTLTELLMGCNFAGSNNVFIGDSQICLDKLQINNYFWQINRLLVINFIVGN